jgi:transposase-like protein
MARVSRYPAEFRQKAIRLYRSRGAPFQETAAELGVAPETLRRWVRQDEGAHEEPAVDERQDEGFGTRPIKPSRWVMTEHEDEEGWGTRPM